MERLGTRGIARATKGRWLGGVCAGLAPFRGLSVGWLRAGFVVLALLGGLGVGLYLACWLIIPSAESVDDPEAAQGVVEVARACAACVGLAALAAIAAGATLFGFGWVVLALAVVVLVAVFLNRRLFGPAWALLPIAALTLPAVAVAAAGLRLAAQAGTQVVSPASGAQLDSTVYRSGLGSIVIDLRHTSLPLGETASLRIEAGVKRTIVALPAGECVRVHVHYNVDPFVAGAVALITGRTTLPYSDVDVFGRVYAPRTGEVSNGHAGVYPLLKIDFTSQGGSLYVRDYPDDVSPQVNPDWPGYITAPEPRPNLLGEPRKVRKLMVRAYRQRLAVDAASQRYIDALMPGPCP